MKKLLYVLYVFILFVFLLGANYSIVPAILSERAISGRLFAGSRGIHGSSTDEIFEVLPKPELKNHTGLEIKVNPLVSGDNP